MPTSDPSEQPGLPPLLPPDGGGAATLGRYQLFARLGSGGHADVYLAVARGALGVDKLVVIKRARPELAAFGAFFVEEARIALRLNHPNLVHSYELGEDRGAHFLACCPTSTPSSMRWSRVRWRRIPARATSPPTRCARRSSATCAGPGAPRGSSRSARR